MKLLLPPSETKRPGGASTLDLTSLAYARELTAVRTQVRDALETVSADETAAVKALKLGVKNRDERLRNLSLMTSGVMPAIDRYTGVLFDALDAQSLDERARAWLCDHAYVQSALFGMLAAGDCIPAYRLSGSSRLPGLGTALAKLWAPAHAGVLDGTDYVLDLRSKDYAALAPIDTLGAHDADVVDVVARGEDGEVRALNHFNKAAKGHLTRTLASAAPTIRSRAELLAWAESAGLELGETEHSNRLRLVTTQGVPAASR